MMNKSDIELCERALVILNNASRNFIIELTKLFPDSFANKKIDEIVRLHFYASVYCATLARRDFFTEDRAEKILELITHITSKSDEYYLEMTGISEAHLEWDEPLYQRSPDHPYESLARYLYLKWGISKIDIKVGNSVVQRPNLAIVYVVDGSLQNAEKVWKGLC